MKSIRGFIAASLLILVAPLWGHSQPPKPPKECIAIITMRPMAKCMNLAAPGSDYCTTHNSPAVAVVHDAHDHTSESPDFAYCVIVDNTIPCNRQAIPGQTYCYYHETHTGPSPTMIYCGYPVRVWGTYVACNKTPINISGRCAEHFVPTPPPPPVPPLSVIQVRSIEAVAADFAYCVIVDNTIPCNRQAIVGKTYCTYHETRVPPSSSQIRCGYAMRCGNNGEWVCPCTKVPINISGRCADHFVPSPPPPPVPPLHLTAKS